MNPKNPVTGINNFLNKNFGLPVPSGTSSPYGISGMFKPPQNMSVPPSNTGATSLKPVAITPPVKKPTLPPSGQTFVQNQVQSAYDAKTGLLTDYGRNQGMKEVNGQNTGATPPGAPNMTPEAPKSESPYLTYLRSMFDPEALKTASSNLTTANTRLADIQSQSEKKLVAGRHASEDAYDASGGLKSGAIESSNAIVRGTNRQLADLATQENAAAISAGISSGNYERMIGAGKSVYDAEVAANKPKEGFSLSKDQARFEYNSKTGKYEQVGGRTSTGNVDDSNVDSWVKGIQSGVYKPSDVPDELKNSVANKLNTAQKPQSEISKSTISVIDELLADPEALNKIAGPIDQFIGGLTNPNAILAKNKYNQLKGLLSLENIKYLKGTGAISDAEQKLLANAASSLGRNLYGEQLISELVKLKEGLNAVNSGGAGGEQITSDEEEFLRNKGYSDEEINAIKQSFKPVGNTTASNIPQRNLNPGNIKKGGLADELAVGTDNQGHLIFPDEETGFKAMKMDLEAKIKGNSRYLPANPTIAQLGKVYAEDPNWSKSVAKMLNIPLNTPTKEIPINNLVQAIARQEGYYA